VYTCSACTSADARELMRARSRPRRTSRETIIGLLMPNGPRTSYRLWHWDTQRDVARTPSPQHTSDSEDTWVHKQRWILLARWVWCWWVYKLGVRKRRQYLRRMFYGHPVIQYGMIPLIARYVGPMVKPYSI